jgi:hypothetical protein
MVEFEMVTFKFFTESRLGDFNFRH